MSAAAAPVPFLQFNNIYMGDDLVARGLLKLHPSAVGWRPNAAASSSSKTVAIPAADVQSATWMQVTPSAAQLRVGMKGGAAEFKFTGVRPAELSAVRAFVQQHYGLSLAERHASAQGRNWGEAVFGETALRMDVGGATAFEVPFAKVAQCAAAQASKTEVVVEFHAPDEDEMKADAAALKGKEQQQQMMLHVLVGMRFHVPGAAAREEEESAAKQFQVQLAERAELGAMVGKGVVMLTNLQMLTPRGRYDMELFPQFIKFHGKSYDYKILYTNVVKLFVLPRSGDAHSSFFVLSLEVPLRQGQQRYTHLVLQLEAETELDVGLNLTEETRTKWPALQSTMKGSQLQLVSDLLSVATARKVTRSGSFVSATGQVSVKCAYRASDGWIYPLETALMFLHKPPVYLRYDDIEHVEFARMNEAGGSVSANRTFDILVFMRTEQKHQFAGIYRAEFSALSAFFAKKGVRTTSAEGDFLDAEDLDAIVDQEGGRQSKQQAIAAAAAAAGMDEDESEEDDDFVLGEESDDEEVPEEYDERYVSSDEDPSKAPPTDDDDDIMHPNRDKEKEEEKKKKKDKEHKHKHKHHHKHKHGGDEEDDDEEEEDAGDGKKKHKHKHKHHHHHHHKHKDGKDDGDKKKRKKEKEKKKKKTEEDTSEPAEKKRKPADPESD